MTETKGKEWREFWVTDDGSWNPIAYISKRKAELNATFPIIHAVEYSAYEALQAERGELVKENEKLRSDILHGRHYEDTLRENLKFVEKERDQLKLKVGGLVRELREKEEKK